jgi:hypothetical protein
MFVLRLADGTTAATAGTLNEVLAVADRIAPNECGVIASGWVERDGSYELDVFDWAGCWCPPPHPVLARVIAPPGYHPIT